MFFLRIFGCRLYYRYAGNRISTLLSKYDIASRVRFTRDSDDISYRKNEFGIEQDLLVFAKSFLKPILKVDLSKYFLNIKSLEEKLRITCIAHMSSGYHTIGAPISYFESYHPDITQLYIYHGGVKSFMFRAHGINTNFSIKHRYIPTFTGVLCHFKQNLKKLINYLNYLFLWRREFKEKSQIGDLKISPEKVENKFAVVFYKSTYFGDLYEKNYFFSSDAKNPLYKDNVAKYIVSPDSKSKRTDLIELSIGRFDFLKSLNIKLMFELIFKNLPKISFFSILYIVYLQAKYSAWLRIVSGIKEEKIIADYDILFPKELLLAFETRGKTTYSFQDRVETSYTYIAGAFYDYYFASSKFFANACSNNFMYCCGKIIPYAFIRLIGFNNEEACTISQLKLSPSNHAPVDSFKHVVSIFDWAYDVDDNSNSLSVIMNDHSFDNRMNEIMLMAIKNPNIAFILRYKYIPSAINNKLRVLTNSCRNIFICNDYSIQYASYILIESSDVIIGSPSSVLTDALAYGKQVIIYDYFYTCSNVASAHYPSDFDFCIVKNPIELQSLLQKVINKDELILEEYEHLRLLISGDSSSNMKTTPSQMLLDNS